MKTFSSFLFALCAFALTSAQATTVIPPTFDELVGQAQLIFQGQVTDVKSEWTGEGAQRRIVTYVTFRVEDAIKGDSGENYTVRMLGGTVDGVTMEVSESPKFKLGDRDILFVENNGQQFIPLVGIMHGRFRVKRDEANGREIVVDNEGKRVGDLNQLGKPDQATAQDAVVDNALGSLDFKSAIRAKLAQTE